MVDKNLKIVEEPFSSKVNFSDEKFIYNKQYPLISTKDITLFHTDFKAGVVNYVTGLLAKKIINASNGVVTLFNEEKEMIKQKEKKIDELIEKLEKEETEKVVNELTTEKLKKPSKKSKKE